MTNPYRYARNAAFHAQGGHCHYCEFPMWLTNLPGFAIAHDLTLRQAARLQATAEHLLAQQDGGRHGKNIVAACYHCNQSRHRFRPRAAPAAARYRELVQRKVRSGKWHPQVIFNAIQKPPHLPAKPSSEY